MKGVNEGRWLTIRQRSSTRNLALLEISRVPHLEASRLSPIAGEETGERSSDALPGAADLLLEPDDVVVFCGGEWDHFDDDDMVEKEEGRYVYR